MKISAVVKCQLLDNELLEMTKEAVATIKPYVQELILVDQASEVGQDWMIDTADIYIRNNKSGGFPLTVHQGMGVATGDYVAILNNDILFEGDWVTPLIKLFKKDVGLVHPYMIDWGEPKETKDNIVYNLSPKMGLYFSAFILDPKIYKEIGGWDIDYDFWGYDDWDYYYRMRKAHYNSVWTDKVCYWHKGGATIRKIGRDYFVAKNKQRFIDKHGRVPEEIDWAYLQ
jgi:GT2 family glycosyltransferase